MHTIDFVAPPFAGHLFPAIQLAKGLAERGAARVRILSTCGAKQAVTAAGLEFHEFLPGRDAEVWSIANTAHQVGSNPVRLWNQVHRNLALMRDLQHQLQMEWQIHRPDLVLADFVVPVAGLTAQRMGIAWWTGMPTPCALETSEGTPAYLGGWRPRNDLFTRLRDRVGRRVIRTFKSVSSRIFARPLRELGIDRLYRSDGSEVVYSPECILGYGMREFEFERNWPSHFEFIGPLCDSPLTTDEVYGTTDRPKVLISLGTHLHWAKDRAIALMRQVAESMPDCTFHFSRGVPGSHHCESHGNFHIHDFISYTDQIQHFSAAVIHGGTGITYSCLRAAVPMLVWPQDYDQFDHAARIVHHGLGRRLHPAPERISEDLKWLMSNPAVLREQLDRFQLASANYDPVGRVASRIQTT